MPERRRAFTLIELLIVVAIIAILAAIAVPNFLEVQTRAKVSRAKADMRTVATALEAYAVDYNVYPLNDGQYNVLPVSITTPVAYVTNSRLVDPFSSKEILPDWVKDAYPDWDDILATFYTYTCIVSQADFFAGRVKPDPPVEAIDGPAFNRGAFRKYGRWRLVSNGPDRAYRIPGLQYLATGGSDILYDSTNGTVSRGNILRTQKSAIGRIQRP